MQNQHVSKLSETTAWFCLFLFLHTLGWSAIPAIVRVNLPMDSIEGTIWGHQLLWGYDKNPFMNAWLTALATWLDGQSGWMLYLFCQLSVAAALLAVWQLGRKMMPAAYALAAVLLLEGIQYYNFHALDFNDNTLELGLWAGAIYFFYGAIKQPSIRNWVPTGILLALGMMTKYYTLALIAGLGLYLLRKENRAQLATLPPYIGLVVFIAIMLPHIIWLTQNDYITITYMLDRGTAEQSSWTNHLFYPAQFVWQQFEAFFPALVIFLMLFIGKRPFTATPRLAVARDDIRFLFYAALLPFLLTALLSFALGIKLRAGWGMPLMSFWPLYFLAVLQPRLSSKKIAALFGGTLSLLLALLIGYSISLLDSPDTSSANFPGKEIAATLNTRWRDTYHTPLSYVAGDRWLGGNISFYSSDHPTVFMEWDAKRTTWINLDDMKKKGAIFVWDISREKSLPAEVAAAYPKLSKPVVMEFNWQHNTHRLAPVKLGVAFLPPSD